MAPALTTTVPLRWRDFDVLGHLNQAVYHELLEEARAAFLTDLVRRIGLENAHGGFVVRRVELDHLHEIRPDGNPASVTVTVERVGDSSLTLAHEIRVPDGTVCASGRTIIVGWDPQARGKRSLSAAERAVLSAAE